MEGEEIDVQEIARLCRIELNSEEVYLFQEQLRGILEYFSRIKEVDITDGEQGESSGYVMSVTREDSGGTNKSLELQSLEMNAPLWHEHRFVVPEPRTAEN